jgi:predicted membrane protein
MNEKKYSMTPQAIIGIIVLLLGLILTLGNFDVIEASSVLRYWPVLLVVFGAVKAFQPGRGGGRIFGAAVALIGLVMLFNRAGIVWFSLGDLWPLLLILLGASLMLKSTGRNNKAESTSEYVNGTAILGGIEQRNSSLYFKGGSVSGILGGHDIDLRQADIPDGEEAVLEVFAFMGGVEVKVPDDWTVVLDGSAFLGGFESKAMGDGSGRKKLTIRGQAILGGVEVRN